MTLNVQPDPLELEPMRRTLAALALAITLPAVGLQGPAAHAQSVVVVKTGETLSEIAERHGVSLTRLMQANGISDADLVVVGQRLTIPGGSSRASGAGGSGGGSVTVQAGDTLSDIAVRQGVSLTRLMQANGISDADLVVVGQRLTIPGSGRSAARPARSQQPTAPYTVKSGETLSEIAVRFNTSTERLIQLNGIENPDQVMSGTRLRIPMAPRPAGAKPAAAPARPAPDRKTREHVVQDGESLSVIAERYGTSVSRLVALNRIEDPDRLLAGTRLQLRGQPPAAPAKPAPKPQTTAEARTAAPEKPAPKSQPATQTTPAAAAQSAPQPAAAKPAKAAAAAATPAAQPAPEAAPKATASPEATGARPAAKPTTSQQQPQPKPAETAAPAPAATAAAAAAAAATTPAATAAGTTASSPAVSTARATAAGAKAAATTTAATTAAATTTAEATSQGLSPRSTTRPATVRQANTVTSSAPASRIGAATDGIKAATASSVSTATAASGKATTAARAVTSPSSSPGGSGDWRPYGPLQIDWSKWQQMGGSYVAPSLNTEGKARYLAVNCTAGKLNTTTPAGQWNTWVSPEKDFEKQLVQDICKEKGS